MNHYFIIKRENGKIKFVYNSEWSLGLSSEPKPMNKKSTDFIIKNLQVTELRKMISVGGGQSLYIPLELHIIAEMSLQKPSAKFEIEVIEVDFNTKQMSTSRLIHFEIDKISNEDGILPTINIKED